MLLATLLSFSFHATFAWFVSLYVDIWRLHYDQNDPWCAFLKSNAERGHLNIVVVYFVCVFILFMSLVSWTWEWTMLLFMTGATIGIIFLAATCIVRGERNYQVLSARYLERKYGVDFSMVMEIVDGGQLQAYPILALEEHLGLSGDQMGATVVDDPSVRELVRCEIENLHLLLLSHIKYTETIKACYKDSQLVVNNDLWTLLTQLRKESSQ